MENSSKALYIAGSVLMAVIVVSFLIYSFNNMGILQKAQDTIEYEEEISKFNLQYEAFDKRLMYGVDVISCINKAVSNNDKYVKSKVAGNEALVQVCVYLKDGLKESYQVYYINNKGKEALVYDNNDNFSKNVKNDFKNNYSGQNFLDFFRVKNNQVYNMPGGYIEKNDTLAGLIATKGFSGTRGEDGDKSFKKKNSTMTINGKSYICLKLLCSKKNDGTFDTQEAIREYKEFCEDNTCLYILANNANNMVIVRNNDEKKVQNKDDDDDDTVSTWSSVKWTTPLADFKKRKFSCHEINYSSETGRIDAITFIEK